MWLIALYKLLINDNIATGVESVVVVPSALLQDLCDKRPLSFGVLILLTALQRYARKAC